MSPVQMSGQVFDLHLRQKVVFVREIAGGPHQVRGHRFRPRLRAQFELPLHAIVVPDYQLGVGSVHVLRLEGEGGRRGVLLASRPVE